MSRFDGFMENDDGDERLVSRVTDKINSLAGYQKLPPVPQP